MNKKNVLVIVLIFSFLMIYNDLASADSIVGSKHDFSWSNRTKSNYAALGFQYYNSAGISQGPVREVCVFCHTPHHASTAGPLWNRRAPVGAANGYTPYSSPTMSLTILAPTGNSLLCLSCHDGITGIAVDNNASPQTTQSLLQPGSGGRYINQTSTVNGDKIGLVNDGNLPFTGWGANIGGLTPNNPTGPVDLSNDHPVSFTWQDGIPGIKLKSTINPALRFFGPNKDRMECSTCHNVHDKAIPPFLAMSNTNSDMCLACHDK